MYHPKISIVIPAYNASNYLAEAIESALAQTYQNIEIIVVNDGSKDDGATERIALSYGNKIRYIYKENGGSSSALNVGIANMTGEWFSWLSHDDLYLPDKLETQVVYLSNLKIDSADISKHIIFSDSAMIDASGQIIRKSIVGNAAKMAERIATLPHNGYLVAEPTAYIFHGCSCLIHKDAFADIGCLDEGLRYLNDVELWFRLYSSGYHVHFIPEVLVQGRVHRAQVSQTIGYSYHNPEQDMYWNRSLDWLLENYPDNHELFYLFGRNAYLKGRFAEGDRAYTQIKESLAKKVMLRSIYKSRYFLRDFLKKVYLAVRH